MMTRSQRTREEKEAADEEAAEVSEDAAAEVGKDAAAAVAGIVAAPDAAYEDLALANLPADVRDAATLGHAQELRDAEGISDVDHRDWEEKILDAAKSILLYVSCNMDILIFNHTKQNI